MANVPYETRRSAPRASGPAGALWLVQAFSGFLLVALLALHMIAHHFVVEGGLRDFDQVIDYISNPAIFTITLIFLVVVTLHALLGLRAILLDLSLSPGAVRLVNWTLFIIGAAAVIYGIWLEFAIIGYG
jgi:succinate dehydrogenase hydrophobic anchor subunit